MAKKKPIRPATPEPVSVDEPTHCYSCNEKLERDKDGYYLNSVSTCLPNQRICNVCEQRISRNAIVTGAYPKENPALAKDTKEFLAHKRYPEITCVFELVDGTIAKVRAKSNKILR